MIWRTPIIWQMPLPSSARITQVGVLRRFWQTHGTATTSVQEDGGLQHDDWRFG